MELTQEQKNRYKKNIARILQIPLNDILELREISGLAKNEKGTKSSVYEVIVNQKGSKSYVLKRYNFHHYYDILEDIYAVEKEFINQKSMLKVASRHEDLGNIFPKLLSNDDSFFDQDKSMLMEEVTTRTLEQTIQNSRDEPELNSKIIRTTLETFAKFFNIMPKYDQEIINEISLNSKNHLHEIEKRDIRSYASNFNTYERILGLREIEKASHEFSERALQYFHQKGFMIHDAYPTNISPSSFIDVGNLKIAPIAIQLGCFLGFPSVNRLLKKDKIEYSTAINHFLEHYSSTNEKATKRLTPERLTNAVILAGIYGNIRFAAGLKRANGRDTSKDIEDLLITSKELAKKLEATEISDSIY